MRAFLLVFFVALLVALSSQQQPFDEDDGPNGELFLTYNTYGQRYYIYSTFTPGTISYSSIYIQPETTDLSTAEEVDNRPYEPYSKLPVKGGRVHNPALHGALPPDHPFGVPEFTSWDGLFYEGFVYSSANIVSYSLFAMLLVAVFTL